ncbi:MAG: hypothetical protein HYX41_00170 [Bdellovibrio sp.]|nr:hypothetical protein [Bdellovibrio sp.]
MPYRWRKFYLKRYTKGIGAALVGFLLVFAPASLATITVAPDSGKGGSISPSSVGGNSTLYYYVGDKTGTGNYIDFTPLDLDQTQDSDAPNLTNEIALQISTDKLFTANAPQRGAIYITAMPDSTKPIPIAGVNGVRCDNGTDGSGGCLAKNQYNNTLNRYYAVAYPSTRSVVTVHFNLNTICADALSAGTQLPNGCTSNTFTQPSGSTPSSMQFKVNIAIAPNQTPTAVPTGTPVDTLSNPVALTFQTDSATFSCPSATALEGVYQPATGSIIFNPRDSQSNPIFTLSRSGNQADISTIVVLGNEGRAANTGSDFLTANDFTVKAVTNTRTTIKNLKDSTNGDPHAYQLAFFIQDQSGVYIVPSPACTLSPVYASFVTGLIDKNKCFIATAAFGSSDSKPVQLFRVFRDEVLLKFRAGEFFVAWYYSWSEGAADWILERPYLRVPLLFGMIPLQAMAWLLLHPLFTLTWFFVGVLVVGLVQVAKARSVSLRGAD